MVVVVIITALSALAIPSIVRQMRDRRTRQAAEEIAAIYRNARLRALGRGAAVMVRYASNAGFQVREAVLGGGSTCATLPVTSCGNAIWDQNANIANGTQQVTTFNPTTGVYDGVTIAALVGDPSVGGGSATLTTASVTAFDLCFTPMGQALYRITAGATDPLFPMTGVPVVTVKRITSGAQEGLQRVVVIPPNGLARTDVSQ